MNQNTHYDTFSSAALQKGLETIRSEREQLDEREAAMRTALVRRAASHQRLAPTRKFLHDALSEAYKAGQRNRSIQYTPALDKLMDELIDTVEPRLTREEDLRVLLVQDCLQKNPTALDGLVLGSSLPGDTLPYTLRGGIMDLLLILRRTTRPFVSSSWWTAADAAVISTPSTP